MHSAARNALTVFMSLYRDEITDPLHNSEASAELQPGLQVGLVLPVSPKGTLFVTMRVCFGESRIAESIDGKGFTVFRVPSVRWHSERNRFEPTDSELTVVQPKLLTGGSFLQSSAQINPLVNRRRDLE